jgi:aspartate 1-decarboxylase
LLLALLKARIHRARLTMTDPHYEGSIAIDEDILDKANILPHGRVDIWNVTNGERLTTYALAAKRGSREFMLNGAAARRAAVGDIVIIAAFAQMTADEARAFKPPIVLMGEANSVDRRL